MGGDHAFWDCTSLKMVCLVDGIRTIGEAAFQRCALEDLMLPTTLASIGDYAFASNRGEYESCLRRVKFCGGIMAVGAMAFSGNRGIERITISSKAFVIAERGRGNYSFQFVTNGTIPKTASAQVVIASEGLSSLRPTEMPEVERAITSILGRRMVLGWNRKRERLRDLVAPYEVRYKREATAILELGLWKVKVDELEDVTRGIREECRLNSGAVVVIPNVLPFL